MSNMLNEKGEQKNDTNRHIKHCVFCDSDDCICYLHYYRKENGTPNLEVPDRMDFIHGYIGGDSFSIALKRITT